MPQYYVYKDGSDRFRDGVRKEGEVTYKVRDIAISPLHFNGVENVDWKNIDKVVIDWSSGPNGAPSNLVSVTYTDAKVDLKCTTNSTDFDGVSWERSVDNISFTEIGTSSTNEYQDTIPAVGIYYYRCRNYKGSQFSDYSSVAIAKPSGILINSVNSSVVLADPSSNFFFNNAGQDQPFSVLAIAKSNDLTITNILFSRGNATGLSYVAALNASNGGMNFAIYAGTSTTANYLFASSGANFNDKFNINKLAFTYDGSEAATGMKIYKNTYEPATYTSRTKNGTYNAMGNQSGFNVGNDPKRSFSSNMDLYLLLVCNKELSLTEVQEFQAMVDNSQIPSLSFYANIISINKFNGDLADDLGVHNGTSTAPQYFNINRHLVGKEVILPNAAETAWQSTFKAFKLGWFLHYNMETYNGDETNAKSVPTSAPSLFTAPAIVDVNAWATLAATSGKIDYATLTVSHMYGFSLYEYQNAKWRGSQIDVGGGIIVPTYTQYDIGQTSSDKNIVTKFVSEFNAVNIKPIFYFCIGWARNWTGDQWPKDNYTDADYQFLVYHDFVRERLQELAALGPFAFWLDVYLYYPQSTASAPFYSFLDDCYYAIKAINPNIGVIVNCVANQSVTNHPYFPFDGASTEEIVMPALPADTWWQKTQVTGGLTFPVEKELCATSRVGKWFYHPTTPAALRPLSELQTLYDYAKTAQVPFSVSMNPRLDGTIDPDQVNLVAGINL